MRKRKRIYIWKDGRGIRHESITDPNILKGLGLLKTRIINKKIVYRKLKKVV